MTEQKIKRRALAPAIGITETFGDTSIGLTPRFPARQETMESETVLQTVADSVNNKITPSEETGAPK